MNFQSPEKIASVIENLKTADLPRSPNRALINNLFNGAPPYTKSEVQQNNIQWNVNWGEGSDLLLQGREQLENAHLSTDFAFTVNLPDAPPSKKTQYGQTITSKINRLLKKSLPHLHTQREKWGSVILHGVGSQMWEDDEKWKPYFVAIDDLLIPTDTTLPYDTLNHFCANRRMTAGQLFRKTFGLPEDKRDPGWNIPAVKKVFEQYKDINQNPSTWNWAEHAEKAAEIWKQNVIYFDSDAVPVIWLCDFYYQSDEDEQGRWYRKILLDQDTTTPRSDASEPVQCIYDSKKPYAETLGQILHTQFIDGNNVPPFMYHSVRGLGMRLFDSVQALNRLRNQAMQKTMEDLMILFRAQDPVDRARLDQIYLGINYGIIPEGLSFVTKDQRYSIDYNLLQLQLSTLKQLIGEGSQQYTQDIDTGTNKERTAFEVSTLLQQTTRLTGSMLNLSYLQETFAYEEICRRLTKKPTQDFDAKRFQNELKEAGIPEKWINSSRWDIQPVRVLGNGNSQLEQAQAQALMSIRPMLNPEAQQVVLHDYVFSFTHDPKRANQLAPLDATPPITDTMHDTEIVFGALMSGSMVTPKPGLIAAEVVTTMLRLMDQTVQQIMTLMGGVGTPEKVMGLQSCVDYTSAFIQQLAQDEENAEMVKQMNDALGRITNEIKAMGQRLQEMAQKRQQQNGMDPAVMQKMQADMVLNQQKLTQNQQKFEQKMTQTQQKFMADQQRKNVQTLTDVRNKTMQSAATAAESSMESEEPTEKT